MNLMFMTKIDPVSPAEEFSYMAMGALIWIVILGLVSGAVILIINAYKKRKKNKKIDDVK